MAGNLAICSVIAPNIYVQDGITSTVLLTWATPDANPDGLAYYELVGVDETIVKLISCDSGIDRIYIHVGLSAAISESFASPYSYPTGLVVADGNLISSDRNNNRIYIHVGLTSSISTSFLAPHTGNVNGLTYVSGNLISCDTYTDRIYVHDGVSDSALLSFPSPSTSPRGLAYDGANLISCDSNKRIYIHVGVTSTVSSNFLCPNDDVPRGLTVIPSMSPWLPITLKCEGETNPIDITDKTPELTALYHHPYLYVGTHYQVQVCETTDFADLVWDSGKMAWGGTLASGTICPAIAVGTELPFDGTKYYWRIRFWDELDNEGDWSYP